MRYHLPLIALIATCFPCLAISSPLQWRAEDGGNDHWYEVVVAEEYTWSQAKSESESMNYNGYTGHLLTVTSSDENLWVTNNILPKETYTLYWVGGFQAEGSQEPDGGWMWVTDEEFEYSNWYPNSPNDNPHNEDKLAFYNLNDNTYGATWDDRREDRVFGYIVEYEPTEFAFSKPQISVEGGYIKLDTTTGIPPNANDCTQSDHYGRQVYDEINNALYMCSIQGWVIY